MTRIYCGTVPVKVIAPVIQKWVDNYVAEHPPQGRNGQNESNGYFTHGNEGNLEILAFRCGVGARQLRRILQNKVLGGRGGEQFFVDHISFDSADRIITAIDHRLWYQEPLSQYYGPLEVTWGEIKRGYELPEGFDFDSLPQPKKYMWHKARLMKEMAA